MGRIGTLAGPSSVLGGGQAVAPFGPARHPRSPGERTTPPVDFDKIFDEVFPPLYRYCHRLTGDADQAEDAAQEAFVRLLTRDVQGTETGLRVWLFRVATHLIRDRYRVSENRRRLLEKNPVLPGDAPDPERELEKGRKRARVHEVLARLPARDREMLLMREEGFSYREIAEAVEVKATSVGTLLARAQRRFAEAFREVETARPAVERASGREDHEPLG